MKKLTKNKANLVILLAMLIIFSTSLTTANFVCGEVENTLDNISAAWFPVNIYYEGLPNAYTTCDVSPEGNKFCCDTDAIPPANSWNPGDIVVAEIISEEYALSAGPVSKITTTEGFDVLPQMKLEKVIDIKSPKTNLIVSGISDFNLTASFKEPYTNINLEDFNSSTNLCSNCSTISIIKEANFGQNNFNLTASNGIRSFTENIKLTILNWIESKRSIICQKCKGDKVKSNQIVKIDLNLSASHSLNGLAIKEYVPIEWQIINSTGDITPFSDTHNLITWYTHQENITKEYFALSPNQYIRARKYTFKTEAEDYLISSDNITVYKFISYFPKKPTIKTNKIFNRLDLKTHISPDKPLVVETEEFVQKIAIFPTKKIKNTKFKSVSITSADNLENSIYVYKFKTNIPQKHIEKVYLEFNVSKNLRDEYGDLHVYFEKNKKWERSYLNHTTEDENYLYFETIQDPVSGIAIIPEEISLFRRIFRF